jgi:NTE family protein
VNAHATSAALRAVPMLADVGERQLDRLAARAAIVDLSAGAWLFRSGDAGDSLYVLLSGRLQVVREGTDEGVIRELQPGDAVGELALITGSERSSSVRARRDSQLLKLARADFDGLLAREPSFARELLRAIGAQLQAPRSANGSRPPAVTIALVPLHGGAPVTEVSRAVGSALDRHGSVLRLDSRHPADARALDRAEATHDWVVLDAASEDPDDPWTSFCLGQADRVVGIASEPPRAGQLRHGRLERCDLAYLASAGRQAEMTPWLDAVRPEATYVLRPGVELAESCGRLARRLAGRSLGLVLSGGGARAFAHVGVIEELIAAGYTFDRFAGASMGAMVAALYALGRTSEQVTEVLRAEYVKRNPLGDRTLPLVALSRGERGLRMLERVFGTRTIESLDLDYMSVSCDLCSQELVAHRRGQLVWAVAASMALPGHVPPVPHEGRLLIDGGVLNNLPVDPMSRTGEGPIVAVDVVGRLPPPRPPSPRVPHLRRWITGPAAAANPKISETLMRTVLLGGASADAAARRQADVVIAPKLRRVGTLQFGQLDQMRELGRAAARDALARGALEVLDGPIRA